MIVIEGKRRREMTAAELDERMAAGNSSRLVIDIGTGDGRFAYAYATDHPDTFVVGMDAIAERLEELSTKATRKPAKGGRPNVLFVRASVEQPPPELEHRADELHVLLPWGGLLVGTMLARPDVMAGLSALAKPGARLTIVFNGEVWEDSTPKDMADLPAVTVEYVESELRPRYRQRGIELDDVHEMSPAEIKDLPTTWARRLAHGRHPKFVAATGCFATATERAPEGAA
jgi:16S rRNA (adenine(1408)-N(1))-methyltransferase